MPKRSWTEETVEGVGERCGHHRRLALFQRHSRWALPKTANRRSHLARMGNPAGPGSDMHYSLSLVARRTWKRGGRRCGWLGRGTGKWAKRRLAAGLPILAASIMVPLEALAVYRCA